MKPSLRTGLNKKKTKKNNNNTTILWELHLFVIRSCPAWSYNVTLEIKPVRLLATMKKIPLSDWNG